MAWNNLGLVHWLAGRFPEAIAAYGKTLDIDPEDLNAHYNLMRVYRAMGDRKNADLHDAAYRKYKDDESIRALMGPYRLDHSPEPRVEGELLEHGLEIFLRVGQPALVLGDRRAEDCVCQPGRRFSASAREAFASASRPSAISARARFKGPSGLSGASSATFVHARAAPLRWPGGRGRCRSRSSAATGDRGCPFAPFPSSAGREGRPWSGSAPNRARAS